MRRWALLLVAVPALARAVPLVVEDDWPRALALARERDRMIFVDAWAPW